MQQLTNSIDTGLACLVLTTRLMGVNVNPEQLQHQMALGKKQFQTKDILRAANIYIKVKAKSIKIKKIEKVNTTPLPAIAKFKDGRYFLLLKSSDSQVLIQDVTERHTKILDYAELEKIWTSELILIQQRGFGRRLLSVFNFKWFLVTMMKYKKILAEVLLASLFIQILALITPLFFQVIIDKVLVHRGLSTLNVLAIGLLVVGFFEVLLTALRTYQLSHTSNRLDVELGMKLVRHIFKLPISYFEARRVGDTITRVRELESIRSFLTGSALTSVLDVLFVVVFLLVMWHYSSTLTLVVLAIIPIYIILSAVATPIFRARLNEKFNCGAESNSLLVEVVTGIQTVKSLSAEHQMRKRWEERLARYVTASFKTSQIGNVVSQIASYTSKFTTAVTIWLGAKLVINGDISIGQLIAFNMMSGRVISPVLRIVQLWQDFQQAQISVQRLGDILNAPQEPGVEKEKRKKLPTLTGNINFENITFRYPGTQKDTLHNISLNISQGEMIGIVGHSGSGKSTLTKLLQRLYVPQYGRILIDGLDISTLDPGYIRRCIGVVLQENYLFNSSIYENIILSDTSFTMDDAIEAAKLAGAHEFITEFPQGYNSPVGERGSNLSGGQRQRIAIARALITKPKILIFDEATSALDYESEYIIKKNMHKICEHCTALIITHRLSTIETADRIVVIDSGHLVEEGTHQELLQAGGAYAKLNQYQSEEL